MDEIKKDCLRKAVKLRANGWPTALKHVQKQLHTSYYPEAIDKALDAVLQELPTCNGTMLFYERLEMEQYLERERRCHEQLKRLPAKPDDEKATTSNEK